MRLSTDSLNRIENQRTKHLILAAAAVAYVRDLKIVSANRANEVSTVPEEERKVLLQERGALLKTITALANQS